MCLDDYVILVIPPVIGMILLWDIDGMWGFSDDVIYIRFQIYFSYFRFVIELIYFHKMLSQIMGNSSISPSQQKFISGSDSTLLIEQMNKKPSSTQLCLIISLMKTNCSKKLKETNSLMLLFLENFYLRLFSFFLCLLFSAALFDLLFHLKLLIFSPFLQFLGK